MLFARFSNPWPTGISSANCCSRRQSAPPRAIPHPSRYRASPIPLTFRNIFALKSIISPKRTTFFSFHLLQPKQVSEAAYLLKGKTPCQLPRKSQPISQMPSIPPDPPPRKANNAHRKTPSSMASRRLPSSSLAKIPRLMKSSPNTCWTIGDPIVKASSITWKR